MARPARGERFRYDGWDVDERANRLVCRYSVDGGPFAEEVVIADGGDWTRADARAAARLVYLLAGVSYYKTTAAPVIDLGGESLTAAEAALLRAFYVDGLGEFAYVNGLDLRDVELVHATRTPATPPVVDALERAALVPFGGGLDSIVTVEMVRPVADAALFVVNRPGDRFAAIEGAAEVTGMPVVRAERAIDPALLDPARRLHWFNGHVPITGVISAIAVLTAALQHRPAVVMSNEWSASSATLEHGGRRINHQWSKSLEFEALFRAVVTESIRPDLEYFSRLRPYSELWIARRFAELTDYHRAFHSCNRAFASDAALRLDRWCGVCPKCCFVDLVLAPFLGPDVLGAIFDGREPLANPDVRATFESLLATSDAFKPFECVGDVDESRAAVLLAAARPDRRDFPLLHELAGAVRAQRDPGDVERFFRPASPHFVPDAYATDDLLV